MTTDDVKKWIRLRLEEEGYVYKDEDDIKQIIESKINTQTKTKKGAGLNGFLIGSQKTTDEWKEKYGSRPKTWKGFYNEPDGQTTMGEWAAKSNKENETFKKNMIEKIQKATGEDELNRIKSDLRISEKNYQRETMSEIGLFLNKNIEGGRESDTFQKSVMKMKTVDDVRETYDIADKLKDSGIVTQEQYNDMIEVVKDRLGETESIQEDVERKVMAQIDRATTIEALDRIDPEVGVTYPQTDRFKEAIAIQRNRLRQP